MAATLSATPSALDNDLIDLILVALALMLVRIRARSRQRELQRRVVKRLLYKRYKAHLAWDEDRFSFANLQRFEQTLVTRDYLKNSLMIHAQGLCEWRLFTQGRLDIRTEGEGVYSKSVISRPLGTSRSTTSI
jgi:hypothetical protein